MFVDFGHFDCKAQFVHAADLVASSRVSLAHVLGADWLCIQVCLTFLPPTIFLVSDGEDGRCPCQAVSIWQSHK
jgi:hypothetical protein